tara:strand:+ start:1744 stop:2730 length:987 start_codon:yes stop_codon:yes gene_type:complete
MSELIDALPGIELPVSDVTQQLATMWDTGPQSGLTEARASQMNVVLHLGTRVQPAEALKRFEELIEFSHRYPCRIIVLCPKQNEFDGSMQAKLFSQCYIGASLREMCCSEALLLSYEIDNSGFLSNQVSVWLESDLPTYHWFCGVRKVRVESYCNNLLHGVRRVLFDSSEWGDAYADIAWPQSLKVKDLAAARLLPVRQALGQYLSAYTVAEICDQLRGVRLVYHPDYRGEANCLLQWIQACIQLCGAEAAALDCQLDWQLQAAESDDAIASLSLEFQYANDYHFTWVQQAAGNLGEIRAFLGKSDECIPTRVKPLSPAQALSEALLF